MQLIVSLLTIFAVPVHIVKDRIRMTRRLDIGNDENTNKNIKIIGKEIIIFINSFSISSTYLFNNTQILAIMMPMKPDRIVIVILIKKVLLIATIHSKNISRPRESVPKKCLKLGADNMSFVWIVALSPITNEKIRDIRTKVKIIIRGFLSFFILIHPYPWINYGIDNFY